MTENITHIFVIILFEAVGLEAEIRKCNMKVVKV